MFVKLLIYVTYTNRLIYNPNGFIMYVVMKYNTINDTRQWSIHCGEPSLKTNFHKTIKPFCQNSNTKNQFNQFNQ